MFQCLLIEAIHTLSAAGFPPGSAAGFPPGSAAGFPAGSAAGSAVWRGSMVNRVTTRCPPS